MKYAWTQRGTEAEAEKLRFLSYWLDSQEALSSAVHSEEKPSVLRFVATKFNKGLIHLIYISTWGC